MKGAKTRVVVSAALAALWLTACGGGGGGGDTVAQVAAPAPAPAPGAGSGASAPPPPATSSVIAVSADTQLQANKQYEIRATGPVTVTLPASAGLAVGDTVGITGVSGAQWLVAQNADQAVLTSGLSGNVAPGTAWTPRLAPRIWHWVSMNPSGQVIIAGEAAGGVLSTSRDGGQTWTSGNSTGGIWISSDMTATGDRMVAVQYGGGMYVSTDFGVTWNQVTTSPLVSNASGVAFESVTMSQDGQRIATVIQDGPLVVSNDAGATWRAATLPGARQTRAWRAIDSSADGQVIVAAAQDPDVFISTDAGATFRQLPVAVGGAQVFENWYRLKVSADGKTIALAANTFGGSAHTGIFVTHDGGATWTKPFAADRDYSSIAMSADGQVIGATLSNYNGSPGQVIRSTDGGATFSPLTIGGTDTDWRAMAMSADGNKMAVAAGLFTTGETGLLSTSLGNRTSVGTAGSIAGGQNASVVLRYAGNGQWAVQNTTGGPFSIK